MGPTQCKQVYKDTLHGATSVFTSLYQYANVINSTIQDTERILKDQKPRSEPDTILSKSNSTVIHYKVFRLTILLSIIFSLEHLYIVAIEPAILLLFC